MEFEINSAGDTREIVLNGRLTFSDHETFRGVVSRLEEMSEARCVINVAGLEFIDSAGLGLLIIASQKAKKMELPLEVHGASGQVKRMFEISNFDKVVTLVG